MGGASFADGAVVRLRSGGPAMTVSVDPSRSVTAGAPVTSCVWHDRLGRLHWRWLPTAGLERVS